VEILRRQWTFLLLISARSPQISVCFLHITGSSSPLSDLVLINNKDETSRLLTVRNLIKLMTKEFPRKTLAINYKNHHCEAIKGATPISLSVYFVN
jgi:hypothetical protein